MDPTLQLRKKVRILNVAIEQTDPSRTPSLDEQKRENSFGRTWFEPGT